MCEHKNSAFVEGNSRSGGDFPHPKNEKNELDGMGVIGGFVITMSLLQLHVLHKFKETIKKAKKERNSL